MRGWLLAGALALLPSVAFADPLTGLKLKDCGPGGVIDNLALRDRVIAERKVLLSLRLAQSLAGNSLGALAAAANSACLKGSCSADQAALQGVFTDALDLTSSDRPDDANHTVVIDETQAPVQDARRIRAVKFLDGQADWLTVTCNATRMAELQTAKAQEVAAGDSAGKAPPKAPKEPLWSRVIIGAGVADIAQSFDKRSFATIGYAEDGKKGTDTKTADIVFALRPMPLLGAGTLDEVSWTPFLELDRKTAPARADELNDLGLGMTFITGRKINRLPLMIQGEGGWQTDDRFNASLWRGAISASPPSWGICARAVGERTSFRCSTRVLADYANVSDPGDKKKLKELSDYARVGLDFEVVFGWQMANDAVLSWRGAYQARRPFDGSDADAELWNGEISIAPSKASHFNFSLSYTAGESLDSLVPIEQLQIKLGVRK
jgi:hypothetical protein